MKIKRMIDLSVGLTENIQSNEQRTKRLKNCVELQVPMRQSKKV